MRDRIRAWGARALLAALLLVCSEILWWSNDPLHYSLAEWGALVVLYLALAALVLDLVVRFQVADAPGLLLVAGIYGLLNATLIAHSAFTQFPVSLVSRPFGLHTLGGGVLGIVLWRWLLDGRGLRPLRLVVLAGIGVLWGLWVRWFPLLPASNFPVPALGSALALAGGGLVVVGLLAGLVHRAPVSDDAALRLRPLAWLPVGGVLIVALIAGMRAGAIASFDVIVLVVLLGYMVSVLAFLNRRRGVTLLSPALNEQPARWIAWLVYGGLLLIPAALGYTLPGTSPDEPPFLIVTAVLTVFGLAWLPGVSLAAGLRAYIRLFRTEG